MAKGMIARFFGGKSKNSQTKNSPVKKSRVVTDLPEALPSTSRSPPLKKTYTSSPNIVDPPLNQQKQMTHTDKDDYLFSDTKDKLTDMNEFINATTNNDINLYLKNLDNLSDRVSYQTNQQDEYASISSAASSNLSLQDALFSHLSDSQSEISHYSDSPKIAVRTHERVDPVFDRPSYSIADTNSNHYIDTIPTNLNDDALYYDKYFCDLYIAALKHLSNLKDPSPAQAFRLFELVARQGHQIYSKLNKRTQLLVSFAQYRAGRMLCESVDESGIGLGFMYLLQSSENGNAHAAFILGCYNEKKGELDQACHLYYKAALDGILPAKVSFGNCILFKKQVAQYHINDALLMLDEASQQGHSIASLSLALYYEKCNNLQKALKYSNRVKIPPSSPIFCVSTYQLGIIFLKAGLFLESHTDYTNLAFRYFGLAAKAPYYENGQLIKFTVALRKLGVLSLKGIGTAKNPFAAFSYIQEAAEQSDEPANILLGQMYLMGLGCPVDRLRAMQIFSRYQHNIAAKLSRALLIMKENPQHAYKDFVDVIGFKCTSFDEEHWDCKSIKYEAGVRVAVWEYNGIGGTEKNPARAFRTLKILSEECGYSGAHYWLAWAYLDGVTLEKGEVLVPKDQDKAFDCFLRGAKQNKAECQYQVGLMLKEGYSKSKYTKKDAFDFFLAAANRDLPIALTQVGVYYYSGGLGTQGRDPKKAFQYFTAAAKHNDSLAIQYLADYLIKDNTNGPIEPYHIYNGLNYAAAVKKDPIAYRMLALVVNSRIDPKDTYESPDSKHQVHKDLLEIYNVAKADYINNSSTIRFQFALQCLWKAIELGDHSSGQYLCNFCPKMNDNDIIKTLEVFEKVETGVANKLTLAYAQFLKVSKNKPSALAKFIRVAKDNAITSSTGWNARIEAAKLILVDHEGKSKNKARIFNWLNEMITYNGKNLFIPFILLGKCHDEEICAGCDKTLATQYYENGLVHERKDTSLEIYARMRLIEVYYRSHADTLLKEQLKLAQPLVESLIDAEEKKSKIANLYYYQGLLALHNGTIVNYRDIAEKYLIKSKELGNILACLELGYLYGTMIGQEEAADTCFQEADNSKKFSFKNRITESMVSSRFTTKAPEPYEYLVEINKMKLAAGITYTCYNMERQALDWFQEISDNPLARIMILYYKMKDSKQRTPHAIKLLSDLMSPFEATPSLDYYGCMALSYGQLRLGQCYEHGHGVAIDDNKVLDYYSKACAYLKNNETYERLAEISNKNGSDIDLFPILCNAAHNDIDATFRLAQYYHDEDVNPVDPDVPNEKAARQYSIAAKAGHAESCYYYAKYKIHQKQQSVQLNVATNSKKAAGYLRIAANKNHGPSYYELGKLEIAAGLFEEGIDDLKQASFLHCAAASYELGELHRQGFTGVIVGHPNYRLPSNLKKALKYYHRAIELNHPLAMIQVGHFFETGALGQQSLSQAEAWYFKALHSGQCREGAAEYALGCLEETRLSISNAIQHRKFAYEWFEKSFNANNKQAKFKKGCYLLHGWATETDSVKKGIKILEDEYQDSNVQAIKELARYYQDQGNNKSAIFYWRKAKELHDPEAFEFLAQCFEKGLLGQDVNMEAAASLKKEAIDARKLAVETQRSMMGFKSDYSEERNDC